MKTLMKRLLILGVLIVLVNACGKTENKPPATKAADTDTITNAINDTSMGLSKTSVFDTPEPEIVNYSGKFPGSNDLYSRAYPDAPPQIPHNIESFKPVTAKNNACVGCHHNPAMIGKEISKGTATPMPPSHYTDQRHKPDSVTENLIGARYVCTQCHVPQANVSTLVDNLFGKTGQL